MAAKNIYIVYENGVEIGEHSAKEIMELIGISRKEVSVYADTGLAYKGRYTLEEVENAPVEKKFPESFVRCFTKEWDKVTERLLASGR